MSQSNPISATSTGADRFRGYYLANRLERLGAYVFDVMITLVLGGAVVFLYLIAIGAGGVDGMSSSLLAIEAMMPANPIAAGLLSIAFSLVGLLLVHGYPLYKNGQTWGKRFFKIKIVDAEGAKPPIWKLVLLRYLAISAIPMLPLFGGYAWLVSCLPIFAPQRRCLHDYIAGTRVVCER
jgi:uncharacterized RDD family membrane protein YckC